jgi:hypothetical protein
MLRSASKQGLLGKAPTPKTKNKKKILELTRESGLD